MLDQLRNDQPSKFSSFLKHTTNFKCLLVTLSPPNLCMRRYNSCVYRCFGRRFVFLERKLWSDVGGRFFLTLLRHHGVVKLRARRSRIDGACRDDSQSLLGSEKLTSFLGRTFPFIFISLFLSKT